MDHISKRAQVRDALLELLRGLGAGAAIPPERRLAQALGVSRPTLRAAIDELVREGRLVPRHGSGTYVAEPKLALAPALTSFTEDMRGRGMRPGSRVLRFERLAAGTEVGRRLRISPVDEVWAVRRLRLADGVRMAIEQLHVPRPVVPELRRDALEGASFYELLQECHDRRVATGVQTVELTVTTGEEAQVLGVPEHAPAFRFERVTESEQGEVVEYVRSVYRGDRYRLTTELRPVPH